MQKSYVARTGLFSMRRKWKALWIRAKGKGVLVKTCTLLRQQRILSWRDRPHHNNNDLCPWLTDVVVVERFSRPISAYFLGIALHFVVVRRIFCSFVFALIRLGLSARLESSSWPRCEHHSWLRGTGSAWRLSGLYQQCKCIRMLTMGGSCPLATLSKCFECWSVEIMQKSL